MSSLLRHRALVKSVVPHSEGLNEQEPKVLYSKSCVYSLS